jgi:hypothetical protein
MKVEKGFAFVLAQMKHCDDGLIHPDPMGMSQPTSCDTLKLIIYSVHLQTRSRQKAGHELSSVYQCLQLVLQAPQAADMQQALQG